MYENEIKAIKLIQDRNADIESKHSLIGNEIEDLKKDLMLLGGKDIFQHQEVQDEKERLKKNRKYTPIKIFSAEEIYKEAEKKYPEKICITDILTNDDIELTEKKIQNHIKDFNARYNLDAWDYAISVSCGLFAAMLDILCIKAPASPTVAWNTKVDGIFNQWVQTAFNKILDPERSKNLSIKFPVGSADCSTTADLLTKTKKILCPANHRLKALSHDPLLSFIFGIRDMKNGTCTVVHEGKIVIFKSTKEVTEGNIFQLLGKMFGHLLSDVNAPSANGNRGMGLPVPFMGILRMLENIPFGDSNFGRQIEYMYIKGYDFRHFVTTTIPTTVMEVLLRTFYTIKQIKIYGDEFGKAIIDTMPFNINPKFRIILALSYGTFASINAGKVYITKNILNANYSAWMGFAWNTFFSLKWALIDKHLKLWSELEEKEIKNIENIIKKLDNLKERAGYL